MNHFRCVQRSGLEMLSLHEVLNPSSLSTPWPWKLCVLAFRIFPNVFDGHSMLTIFSLYLHVLFPWTRFAKGSSLCSCILKSPECGSEWTQIRYVMFLYAVFHGFSVQDLLENALIIRWTAMIRNPILRNWGSGFRPNPPAYDVAPFQNKKMIGVWVRNRAFLIIAIHRKVR